MLAEPNRRLILDLLREQERPVNELVDALALGQPAVSKHFRVLRNAGFVESPRRRPAPALQAAIRTAPRDRRVDRPLPAMWASSLSALEEHLEQLDDATDDATSADTAVT